MRRCTTTGHLRLGLVSDWLLKRQTEGHAQIRMDNSQRRPLSCYIRIKLGSSSLTFNKIYTFIMKINFSYSKAFNINRCL
jgi:hypothetical protein